MPIHVPAFLLTTWLLAMLPGPGQALMIRQTLTGGPARARATIAGIATGLLVWAATAAAGLSAVLLAAPGAYQAVRAGGGIVLVVLGVTTLRAARHPADEPVDEDRSGGWTAYVAGLGTTLGNPKAGVFAVSVLPQFVTTDGPVLLSSIALGVVWALVNTCWYVLFTWALGHGRSLVTRPGARRGLSIATGVVLVSLGVAVVSSA
ncbi:LysE family translocator [Allokutzneria albata]|uniref:Threonine/homoserine/homoserine lactone efflux protein n=1 Tax=Allokutzneria albata TaxID=211114 RepID=A0A1G9TDS3_ALLAB|nr:LysE family translocator [Allokutzneria albata]SDM45833.1 Threonine/homoserine/homoserine lactone efflux protein [Allokutzneria albata]